MSINTHSIQPTTATAIYIASYVGTEPNRSFEVQSVDEFAPGTFLSCIGFAEDGNPVYSPEPIDSPNGQNTLGFNGDRDGSSAYDDYQTSSGSGFVDPQTMYNPSQASLHQIRHILQQLSLGRFARYPRES
jgi:hypothetical protein